MSLVVIRCDATRGGGLGHLSRGLAIAVEARARGWEAIIVGDMATALARDLVARWEVPVEPEAGRRLDVIAAEAGASIVHIDDYVTGTDARALIAPTGALVSSMEDGLYGRRPADLVVDPTMGADADARPADGSTRVLAGIRYAPMRPEVIAARRRRVRAGGLAHAPGRPRGLVVLGGTDATGAVARVASVVAESGEADLTVIAPDHSRGEISAAVGDSVKIVAPSPAFLDMAADADFVVSAAGTTAWELAYIGLPLALVSVVDNQRSGYRAAVAAGVALGLGSLDAIRADPHGAARRLASWRDSVSSRPAGRPGPARESLVDGRGAARIVMAWEALLCQRTDAVNGRRG